MNRDEAEQIIRAVLEIGRVLDGSLQRLSDASQPTAVDMYRRRVGQILGLSYDSLMRPVLGKFPELTPPELKASDSQYHPERFVLAPVDRELASHALRKTSEILEAARQIVAHAELSSEERPTMEADLAEVVEYVKTARRISSRG